MTNPAWPHSRRAYTAAPVLATLSLLSLSPASAQQASSACKLLQGSEIEMALGRKLAAPPVGEAQNVPGMAVDVCTVQLSGPTHPSIRTVTIAIVKDLPMDGLTAIQVRNQGTAREAQWKVTGAHLEQKTIGKALCILSGRPNVAGHSICTVPRGKAYVEVDVQASVQDLPTMDVVDGLVEKALARW